MGNSQFLKNYRGTPAQFFICQKLFAKFRRFSRFFYGKFAIFTNYRGTPAQFFICQKNCLQNFDIFQGFCMENSQFSQITGEPLPILSSAKQLFEKIQQSSRFLQFALKYRGTPAQYFICQKLFAKFQGSGMKTRNFHKLQGNPCLNLIRQDSLQSSDISQGFAWKFTILI